MPDHAKTTPPAPWAARRARVAAAARHLDPRSLGVEIVIITLAMLIYTGVRKLTEGSPAAAVHHARSLFRLETWLHIDIEPPIQRLAMHHESLRDLANWVYIYDHWPVLIIVALALHATRRERYRQLRNAVFLSGFIGFAFFALIPMAPPRLAGLGIADTITMFSSSYHVLQPPRFTNLYASMPSLHFGWNLLAGLAVFTATTNIFLRALAIAAPVSMFLAVVATGNHFVLDPLVGGVIVLSAWTLVSWRMRTPEPARTAPAPNTAAPFGPSSLPPVQARRHAVDTTKAGAPTRREPATGLRNTTTTITTDSARSQSGLPSPDDPRQPHCQPGRSGVHDA